MTDYTDDNLVALLQKDDEQAFKSLFLKYGTRLYQFALKYLKDKEDAEDLLNEVFLKIWENRQSLKTNLSFQVYLFSIAYNNIRQKFIKKSREEKYIRIFSEKYLVNASKDEDRLDYHWFVKRVNEIIDLLPPRRKEIFILSYKDELKKQVKIISHSGFRNQFKLPDGTTGWLGYGSGLKYHVDRDNQLIVKLD